MRRLFICCLVILSGCASQTSSIQYYLFNPPGTESSTQAVNSEITHLQMGKLTVADYLQQRGLVVQTSAHQIHISKNHLWAEGFEQGFLHTLSSALYPKIKLDQQQAGIGNTPILDITVTHFLVTADGHVVLNAECALRGVPDSYYRFEHAIALQQDGYEHAVEQYRNAIGALALEIQNRML